MSFVLQVRSQNATLVGWVPPDASRSTIDLLWSCLSALIACLWSIQHPMVYPERNWKQRALNQLKWMLVSAVAPEVISYMAIVEFLDARAYTAAMQQAGWSWWTLSHSFYAQMGGFAMDDETGRPMQLSAAALRLVLEQRPDCLPVVSEAALNDMTKADHFTKAFACLQSAWLVLQVIGRAAQRLPVSELEISTTAYIVFLFVTYAFWWKKPQGVCITMPLAVRWGELGMTDQQLEENKAALSLVRISDHVLHKSRFHYRWLLMIGMLMAFGALHLIAWHSHFPSTVERLMWMACSFSLIGLSPGILIDAIFPNSAKKFDIGIERATSLLMRSRLLKTTTFPIQTLKKIPGFSALFDPPKRNYAHLFAMLLYIVARLFMITEMFISLREQPAALYQPVNWSQYIPHI